MNGKRKKKLSVRIYHFFTTVIGLAIFVLGVFVLFHIQDVVVTGNTYTDTNQIIETVRDDPYSVNTLYVMGKYKLGKGQSLETLEKIKVGIKNPWTLKITVTEKPIVGYIEMSDGYAYLDFNGLVVYKHHELLPDIPKIEGISGEGLQVGDTLEATDKQLLQQILRATDEARKKELPVERVMNIDNSVYLIMGNIYIKLGQEVSEEQIAQIGPILPNLEGQEGTLHLENYSEDNDTITFKRGEFPIQIE